MINCDQQQLDMLADNLIIEFKKNPFSYKKDVISSIYTEEELNMFESLLISKMPNLVITHHDTDTEVDLSNQLKRIKDIYLNNMQPYFLDLSKPKNKVIEKII